MAVAITVHIVDKGEIFVSHTFWGETEGEAQKYLEHHKASCSYFRSNYEAGNIVEEVDDEADRPDPDDFDDDEDEQ